MLAKTEDAIRLVVATPPEFGQITELAPGLHWLRLPLPFKLNHVNIWLLDDGDGWSIVDCAANTSDARRLWDSAFATLMKKAPLHRVIATHGHPDHVGLASWLLEQHGQKDGRTDFVSTMNEWLWPQIWVAARRRAASPSWGRFFVEHGCPAEMVARMSKSQNVDFEPMLPMPGAFLRISDGDMFRFGRRDWQVVTASGHAEEHASFWCAKDKILIAGDQILSRITPVIGVFPSEPMADPLAQYLASLPRFRAFDDDALVLPSHGLPFRGLHTRIDQIERHHAERLARLLELMTGPLTAFDLANGLFKDAMANGHEMLAMAETLAHINYLVVKGEAVRRHPTKGPITFETKARAVAIKTSKARPAATLPKRATASRNKS